MFGTEVSYRSQSYADRALSAGPQDFDDVLSHGTLRRLDTKEHVFCEGDPRVHVFRVEEGVIAVYKTLSDGRRQVVDFAYALMDLLKGQDWNPIDRSIDGTLRWDALIPIKTHDFHQDPTNGRDIGRANSGKCHLQPGPLILKLARRAP